MLKNFLNNLKKALKYSIGSVIFLSFLAYVYTLLKGSENTLKSIFDFNYFIGAGIILYGVFVFWAPVNLKKSNKVVDHSNIADVLREEKDERQADSLIYIYWGLCNFIIIGLVEVLIFQLLQ